MEEDKKENELFSPQTNPSWEVLRKSLNSNKEELRRRIDELKKKEESISEDSEEEESFWEKFFATKNMDVIKEGLVEAHQKTIKETMRSVIKLAPAITHDEYVKQMNIRFKDAQKNNSKMADIYEEILNLTRWISEEDFQVLRKKVLADVD